MFQVDDGSNNKLGKLQITGLGARRLSKTRRVLVPICPSAGKPGMRSCASQVLPSRHGYGKHASARWCNTSIRRTALHTVALVSYSSHVPSAILDSILATVELEAAPLPCMVLLLRTQSLKSLDFRAPAHAGKVSVMAALGTATAVSLQISASNGSSSG